MNEQENPKAQSPNSKNSSSGVKTTSTNFNYEAAGEENHNQQYKLKGKIGYPNPPEHANPDAATLREQWRFAIKQYSRWYSHAWGTAILAGLSFFALGWIVKGSNPLPSVSPSTPSSSAPSSSSTSSDKAPP